MAGAGDGKPLEDFDELGQLYDRMVGQWRPEMGHVVNIVGGVNSQEKYGSQPGPRFTPMPAARQKAAMKYLRGECVPDADVPDRSGDVAADRVRWGDQSDRAGAGGGAVELLNDGRNVAAGRVSGDGFRPGRCLFVRRHARGSSEGRCGRSWDPGRPRWMPIDGRCSGRMSSRWGTRSGRRRRTISGLGVSPEFRQGRGPQAPAPNEGEIKNMLRGELRDLDKELASASEKAGDRETRLHLEGVRAQIKEILEPKE